MGEPIRLPESVENAISELRALQGEGKEVIAWHPLAVRVGGLDYLRRAIAAALLMERQVALRQAKALCEELALIDSKKVNAAALACANRIRTLIAQADALEARHENGR